MSVIFSVPAQVLLLTTHIAVSSGNPRMLAVLPETTKQVRTLVRLLNDDDIDTRDKASQELAKFGRLALPTLLEAMGNSPNSEVELRIEKLLPAARVADFVAKYPYFLADRRRKYDHDFVGWDEFKKAANDTPESRKLFAAILASEDSRKSLVAALDKTKEGREKFEKRWEEKYREWFKANRILPEAKLNGNEPITFFCAALIGDLLFKQDYRSYYRLTTFAYYMNTAEGKLAIEGKGEYGGAVIKLAGYWIAQQEGRFGLADAQPLCIAMNFKSDVRVRSHERLVELLLRSGDVAHLSELAMTENHKYVATFKKFFDNDATLYETPFIQMRDAALSLSVALTGQEAKEYGFTVQTAPTKANKLKFWDGNYHFVSDAKQSAEEKRTAAFKKWAEWEKANPKALPPADKK